MLSQWRVLAMAALALGGASCGSDAVAGPTLTQLQGQWTMSWTESGGGLTCTWSEVELSLRDSTAVPQTLWAGGHGVCTGLFENANLTLSGFPLDTLVVDAGHIVFTPRGSGYRFEGSVTTDEMSGTMSANTFYTPVGARVPTTGHWQALRQSAP